MTAPAPRAVLGPPRLAALAGLAMLAVGAALAPRTCGTGDSGEFVLALALAGVPHPSGYPLDVLIGHGFVALLHALGFGWTHAANLWSALGAAVAFGLSALVALRLLAKEPGRGPAAFVALAAALLALALQPLWLEAAAFAEIYSWHAAWAAGAALGTLALLERIERAESGRSAARIALAAGALLGLGLAHHLTSALLSAPLAAALAASLARRRAHSPATLGAAALGALVPLASYAWIAWRASHPAAYQWPPLEPSGVWAHVTGRMYAGAYLGAPAGATLAQLGTKTAAVLALACVALIAYPFGAPDASSRALGWAPLAAATLQVGFALAYGVPDGAVYFLPVLMSGLWVIPSLLARVKAPNARALSAAALAIALAVAAPGWLRETRATLARAAAVDARIRELWHALPEGRAIVLWTDDHYTRLKLLQLLERDHPERIVDNPRMLTWPAARAAFRQASGVDPLDRLELRTEADIARIAANVRRQTALPVVEFEALAGGR